MEKLKEQKDTVAQIIVQVDNCRVVLDNCKIFSVDDNNGHVIFQAQDPDAPERMVQVTLMKVIETK